MESSLILWQHLAAVVLATTASAWISWIAWGKGFYRLPFSPSEEGEDLSWWQVFEAFAIFIAVEMALAPSLYVFFFSSQSGGLLDQLSTEIDALTQGWMNIWSVGCTLLVLLIFLYSLKHSTRTVILGSQNKRAALRSFFFGSISWIVVFPWVLALGQFISLMVDWSYELPHVDQVAVKHLKDISSNPWLFRTTALAIVTVIPFMEELLFRGFFQSWLKIIWGRKIAILLCSLVFALFHFSISQGIENFELVGCLFLLSCFLGFIKEKFGSLWASVGLHSTFNFISIVMLIFSEY